jgi:tRNA dimethylallyltransferase
MMGQTYFLRKERGMEPIVIIAGPTASGKSRLALQIGQKTNGIIINADSMQVYAGLKILTAQPSEEDQGLCPHVLYGCIPPQEAMTAAAWAKMATDALSQGVAQGKQLIVVGGTGLYLRALLEGLCEIPPISSAIRDQGRHIMAEKGVEALHGELQRLDPFMAEKLSPRDTQRVSRAWEVVTGTGVPLSQWQASSKKTGISFPYKTIILLPPRQALYTGIAHRVDSMVDQGVVEEVGAFSRQYPQKGLALQKALGYDFLLDHYEGRMTLEEAKEKTALVTRHYAKRQMTWFRGQLPADLVLSAWDEDWVFPL